MSLLWPFGHHFPDYRPRRVRDPMKIEYLHRYTPATCRAHPDKCFVFGDNLQGRGRRGQAVIRGQPNAFGVPTKKRPAWTPDAFFTDREYDANVAAIDRAWGTILAAGYETIVLPQDGLGTGLARLETEAPDTFAYVLCWLERIRQLGDPATMY